MNARAARARTAAAVAVLALLAVAALGVGAPERAPAATASLRDWSEFGLDPQRSSASDAPTGISAANVRRLTRRAVPLPGTADDSALYLHRASVDGARHDVAIVTTTYGITLALDADRGTILWRFDPPGLSTWAGSAQITTASPLVHGGYVYATSPNGLIHKLALASGHEAPGWPVRITPAPKTEKLTASLNIAGGELLASTGGYYGDAPPYIGHVVAISLANGHVDHVFNTLCANRTRIVDPASCSASDSAILSRGGPVVEPGGTRLLVSTGNAPYNGKDDFGDSVVELTLPGLRLRQVYTPVDQAHLDTGDLDLGSGSPAILPGGLVLIGGKDALLRVLDLRRLDGRAPGGRPRTGGERQTLATPGSQMLFSAPAVSHDLVVVADGGGTAAYRAGGGTLRPIWHNANAGTSPVIAGGLLYVYDFAAGGVRVYEPSSGRELTVLHTAAGHWNSPIVADGHVIVPTGDANEHSTSGQLDIFSTRG